MGRNLLVAAMVGVMVIGGPIVMPARGTVAAQSGACRCSASFDAVDSDLQVLDRYFNAAVLGAGAGCADTCASWWKEWFYRNACDRPVRINRGKNAWWSYEDGTTQTNIGPDTWHCPFPPP